MAWGVVSSAEAGLAPGRPAQVLEDRISCLNGMCTRELPDPELWLSLSQ